VRRFTGNPTTFEAKPASRATATNEEGRCSVVEESKTNLVFSFVPLV
jgi:hypothetical protein